MANRLQDNRYQQLRDQMTIPKSTKVTMTLWGINIFDIAAVAMGVFVGIWLANYFNTTFIFKVILFIVGPILAILLIMRTPYQPRVRNWKVLFSVLAQDRKNYYPIRVVSKRKKELEKSNSFLF
ncbi:AtpZ/AtpI family protein [uncultured Lactobacillus sp.]|uniref:AtpZ/AtpI family protein n=1 Tax=uncultured Lactobacillus sp. TaxID=153152 RepID=UPI00259B4D32|nr:AtpZ/AtpI family protein [uncultured Lactobacillus sp.]